MHHTLSILLQNEPGTLMQVVGVFAARHCNIDSLTVVPTSDPAVSQVTVVLHGNEATLTQIVGKARKLIDVLGVYVLSLDGNQQMGWSASVARP